MALCPDAILKLLPENETQDAIVPRLVIVHSAGGSAELYGWWQNPQSKGLESHFFIDDVVDLDGYARLYQYIDTTVRADANGEANGYAISIETASTVHATEPWPPAMVKTLIRLIDWICDVHKIPRVQVPFPEGSGIGWHVMFGAPGPWTKAAGKVCPGPQRIEQMKKTIIPGVKALELPPESENIMAAITEARFAKLERQVQILFDQLIGTKDEAGTESLRGVLRNIAADADAVEKRTRPRA